MHSTILLNKNKPLLSNIAVSDGHSCLLLPCMSVTSVATDCMLLGMQAIRQAACTLFAQSPAALTNSYAWLQPSGHHHCTLFTLFAVRMGSSQSRCIFTKQSMVISARTCSVGRTECFHILCVLSIHRRYAQSTLKSTFLCRAVIWFVYMLIYGVFPQNLSQGIFHLFEEVMATSPTFWLLIIMAPVACVLPGYLWRQIRS